MAGTGIAQSNMAAAMKMLLQKKPLEKVTVAEICNAVRMNRKSFYYHFRDKYDLVQWIFSTEFGDTLSDLEALLPLCTYFHENCAFYVKVLADDGQNSFGAYLHDQLYAMLLQSGKSQRAADYFADATLVSLQKWLADRTKEPPDVYAAFLQRIFALR